MTNSPPPPLHLYLHIPFCQRPCAYCDFARLAGHASWHDRYIRAVISELQLTLPLLATRDIATIYIGGGSPSFLPVNLLTQLLAAVKSHFTIVPNTEITVECNPHQVTREWALRLLAAGVNRFSLGVQSLNDDELRILRRLHSADDARRAFATLRDTSCANLSVDLMYGLPNQTDQSWHATIREIADDWRPAHVSLYALHLEQNTPLARIHHEAPTQYSWPDDDHTMNWFWYAIDTLTARGYDHYELSNTALPGCACRHNLAYWDTRKHYLGLGAAAHSFCILHPWPAPRRFRNLRNFRSYCARVETGQRWRVVSPPLSPRQQLGEEIYLGLRRINGLIPRPEHLEAFGNIIQQQLASGLLRRTLDGSIALSRRGIEIANSVMAEYT